MAASRAKEEFEQFERRAALAEEQIKLLAKRVEFLEKGLNETTPGGAAPKAGADVAEYQKDLLEKLKHLEATLEAEKKQADAALKERDAAREALQNLEKESAGNAYRITILLKSIAEVEQRNAQLEAQLKEARH